MSSTAPESGPPGPAAAPPEGQNSSTWLPAEQYVQRIPHATIYACALMTDQHGNPLQLHSSIPEHPQRWQWPGGNLDDHSTPFQTAVRETLEETGLHLQGPPRLLAVHFLLPSAAWPLAKVGFMFDGGQLSAEDMAAIRLRPDEHDRWEVRPLEQWQSDMHPRYWRRLEAVLAARASGALLYLSDADDIPPSPG
ncbi:NUDIX domain-containing protein [Streptacidiphilus sp. EB103A]|uniref:NUDIX domain-containing protein n=1 Tax=Streptacidiphilus sp. EB103A TaxID=3156275 RepID=UPI003512ADBA